MSAMVKNLLFSPFYPQPHQHTSISLKIGNLCSLFLFKKKWDVQLWGFGSLFLNSLMHCLAERPPKNKKIIYF
jgi:hypothetical protein